MNIYHQGRAHRKAFTLIELIIVIGLIVVITAVTLPNLFGRKNVKDLTNTATQIATLLHQAQSASVSQKNGLSWGVLFQNKPGAPFFALFSSSSSAYNASGTTEYYRLPNSVGYLPVTSGLAGWWGFDEGTGVVTFDSSGNNNNGALSGTTIPTWTSGKVGPYALNFNGNGQYVDAGTKFPLITSAITISAWVNPGATQTAYADIWGDHQDGFKGMVMRQNASTLNQYNWSYGNGINWINGSGFFNLQTNTWQHVVAVKDSQYCYVYINGTEQVSARVSCADNIVPATVINFSVGIGYSGGVRYFNGQIDDVRVYNRALSAAEINQLYSSSLSVAFSQILGSASASTSIGLYLLSDPSQQSIISIASSGLVSY